MAIKAVILGLWALLTSHALPATLPAVHGIPCSIGQPPLSSADHLSPATGRWMLITLRTGEALCGWKKPGAGK